MKKVKQNSTENCHFYSSEKSLYVAWACFRNVHAVLVRPMLLSGHLFLKRAVQSADRKACFLCIMYIGNFIYLPFWV